jgi:hypothetical protein
MGFNSGFKGLTCYYLNFIENTMSVIWFIYMGKAAER